MSFYSHTRDYALDFVFVVFEAEDGIRYLVRSRGLGDVYKRQLVGSALATNWGWVSCFPDLFRPVVLVLALLTAIPVSYTHLTLPTSDLV